MYTNDLFASSVLDDSRIRCLWGDIKLPAGQGWTHGHPTFASMYSDAVNHEGFDRMKR